MTEHMITTTEPREHEQHVHEFYVCRKVSEDGLLPKGTLVLINGSIPPGWELTRPYDSAEYTPPNHAGSGGSG